MSFCPRRRSPTACLLLATLAVARPTFAQAEAPEAPTAAAANPAAQRDVAAKYDFRAVPDRADGVYRVGDPVTFTCTLLDKATGKTVDADVAWTVSKDGVKPGRTGAVRPGADGTFTVDGGTLDEPGFLRFEATFAAPGAPRRILAPAAGAFERERIAPSMPAPDDLDAFWQSERAALATVPMNVRLTPVATPNRKVEAFDVQADIGDGKVMSGYLVRPVGAAAKSLPAIVLPHPAGVRGSRLSVAVTYAEPGGITENGAVVLDFNAHGLPNDQPASFYAAQQAGPLKDHYKARGITSREDVYFRAVFARLFRAIDVLVAQPEWDGRRVIACGRSQGGGLSLTAGGLDPRVTCVIAEIPALCDHGSAVVNRITGWPHFLPGPAAPDAAVLKAVSYYDAAHFASRIQAPTYVTVGWVDGVCPPTSVYAMFNRLAGPKRMLDLPALGHVISSEGNAFVKASAREYLAR